MFKIAVVDDNGLLAQAVGEAISASFKEKNIPATVETFTNGLALLGKLDERQMFDAYFLDVEMEFLSGVEIAKKIRSLDKEAIIIFVTSHERYAIEGYSCRAFEYIMKDKWELRLPTILGRVQKELVGRETRIFRIQSERRHEAIRWDNVYYFEKNGKNIDLYCKEDKIYTTRSSLADVYKQFPADEFAYINKGQVVNLMHVTHLDSEGIELAGHISLQLSRYHLADIRKKMLACWRTL